MHILIERERLTNELEVIGMYGYQLITVTSSHIGPPNITKSQNLPQKSKSNQQNDELYIIIRALKRKKKKPPKSIEEIAEKRMEID